MATVNQFKNPEYTGENRCIPCTITNLLIAVVASVLFTLVSAFLGGVVFLLSVSAIYFQGYLVPGTPTITKRYFPERVLRWFDKGTQLSDSDIALDTNPEDILHGADAIEWQQSGEDIRLTSDFRQKWRSQIQKAQSENFNKDNIAENLDIRSEDIAIEDHDEALVAHRDNAVISQWSSQAAIVADVAAKRELAERSSGWENLTTAEIGRVLMSLRIFLNQCPACDGTVEIENEAVESCCRSYDVMVLACLDCGAHLFEIEWDDVAENGIDNQPQHLAQAGTET